MKSVYNTKPSCLVFSILVSVILCMLGFKELSGIQSLKTRFSSTKRTNPINRPTGKYLVNPDLSSLKLMFNIITTNMKSTATAPTYTIINIRAKNSAPSKMNKPDDPKKVRINHKTECTGLRDMTTSKAAKTIMEEKK